MASPLSGIKNYYAGSGSKAVVKKAASIHITPLQFPRIRVDMATWRKAATEAEYAYFPFRVIMQQIYQDTILNEHVKACISKRKNLTMQRKFKICDEAGNKDDAATKFFEATWFKMFQSYCLDAIFHGYNLISLGDIVNDTFPNLSFIRRQNVSPDRMCVTSYPYMPNGVKFTDNALLDWFIWVPTPTETGASPCGYGLLYPVAKTEILLRNNTSQNADYNEMFGQPIRKGTTSKQGDERQNFADAVQNMGASPWIIMDEMDKLEFDTSASSGSAYKTYEDFENRSHKKISKLLLGHADAMDSVPGKLGGGQGEEESPTAKALSTIQSEDGEFLESLINTELIPRILKHGFNFPLGKQFKYLNDDEKEEARRREDESNTKTAGLMKSITDAGGELTEETWDWFTDRTGIPGVVLPEKPDPMEMVVNAPGAIGPNGEKAGVLTKQVKELKPADKAKLNGKAKQLK